MAITLAVVPWVKPGDSRAALQALCGELGKILGTTVHGVNPESYTSLAQELEKDRVQYAWMSPGLLVLTAELIQLRPLLSAVRNDSTEYCSALFVDGDQSLTAIEQLQGKTVAWVDTTSASGYLYPRIQLAARGIDPTRLFGRELFLHSHAEVVRAVFDGRADVGATYAERPPDGQPVRRGGFSDVAPGRNARVLELTRPIPNDVIVGHGLIPKTDQRVFSNAILTLAEREDGRRLLYSAFNADRFIVTPRLALQPLWELIGLARSHGLLAHM